MPTRYRPYLSVAVIGILFASLWVGAITVLVLHLQPPLVSTANTASEPTVNIMLYEGEMPDGRMGFGFAPNNLSSPGPPLQFKTNDIVSITVVNSGKIPHAFAIVDQPKTGAHVMFQAEVASVNNPLMSQQRGTVIFTPNYAGATFYYICPISGHAEAGMWGSVIVTG